MLSPRFLRFQAQQCLRTAQLANDPKTIDEHEAMARDLSRWAKEAESEADAKGDRPKP